MGIYVNPGNENYSAVRRDDVFVDKTEMIRFTNQLIYTDDNKICVTRPRRFGKTTALNMLAAYYSRDCDSLELFRDLKIAQDPSFLQHLNQYYVIQMDIQSIWNRADENGMWKNCLRISRSRSLTN